MSNSEYEKPSRGIHINLVTANHAPVVQFLTDVFGAKTYFSFPDSEDKDKTMHTAVLVNNRGIFIEDDGTCFNKGDLALKKDQKIKVRVYVPHEDPESIEAKALENGAVSLVKVAQQFWGSRYGIFRDPQGIEWAVATSSQPLADVPEKVRWNVSPEVAVDDAEAEIEWVKKVFGGKEIGDIHRSADGKQIMHACVGVSQGAIMLSSKFGPGTKGEPNFCISICKGKDEAKPQEEVAIKHGATVLMPVAKQFWGSLYGRFKDPFGLEWSLSEFSDNQSDAGSAPNNCELKDFEGMKVIGKRYNNIAMDELTTLFPKAFQEIGEFIKGHADSIHATQTTAAMYHSMDKDKTGTVKFALTIGFQIDAADKLPAKTAGDIKVVSFPAIDGAAHLEHKGSYATMKQAWEDLGSWSKFNNLTMGFPSYEVYTKGPAQTSVESEYRTDIFATLKRESKRAKKA